MQYAVSLLEVEKRVSKLGFMEAAPKRVRSKVNSWISKLEKYLPSVGGRIVTTNVNLGVVRIELPDKKANKIIEKLEKEFGCKPRDKSKKLGSI